MQVGLGHTVPKKGLALWRGHCHASLRAGVPPLRPQPRSGMAPPNKKDMADAYFSQVADFLTITAFHVGSHLALFDRVIQIACTCLRRRVLLALS